ncbi:hypothetical protein Shel_12450 [Slackia heliotrinireducens DSM 20476]|uniref:Uncharacterized protein n=1 Tax=Slackia heliotrinireducens (strain ATCC 29202 / DSM 20476 / NCTC 11029 / RHS 1) TaxID=471855 RepID=C7N5T8_SLAHD|nr:hypothetical protein Shel_12450 [Slackia heliotrinireducens DSM 20476]
MKNVASVLANLVSELRDITGTIQGCNEFLFVYFTMHSPNSLNIKMTAAIRTQKE